MTDFQIGAIIGAALCFMLIPRLVRSKPSHDIAEAKPFDYSTLEDDIPTVETWFKIRVWSDENEGRSLTG